ncbi:MAG: DedA family protein [Chloroflexota bacterium]|nr:DedA family protein [Chloroflexota bacterium]
MSELIHKLADWAVEIVDALGYVGVFLLVALENLFPPIPSEIILPLAGFTVGQGRLSFAGVIAASTAGSVIGAWLLYGIGHWFGEARLRRFIRRLGRLPFIDEADLDKTLAWFARHGGTAVLIGRLIPVVRSLISIPAGFARMPPGRFTLYTALGSTAWNGLLISAGWILGENWESVRNYTQYFEYLTVLLIAALILRFLWRRWSTRGERAQPGRAVEKARRGESGD